MNLTRPSSPLHHSKQRCWPLQGNKPFPYRQKTTYVWNVAVGSTCLLLVTLSLGGLVFRVLDAVRLRKNW